MEDCCHIRTDGVNYFLFILNKLQKQVQITVGPTFLELLAHQWNLVGLSFLYRDYFGRYLCELRASNIASMLMSL